jgi:hypothetical protein
LAVAVLLLPAAAMAADSPGAVTWVKGDEGPLGLVITEGVWAQRIIAVRNTESKDRLVKVACLEEMLDRGDQVFSRICAVPAGSERRVELAVRPGRSKSFTRPTPGAPPSPQAPKQVQERYAIWDAASGTKLSGDFAPAEMVTSQTLNLGLIPGEIDRNEWYLYLRDMPSGALGDVRLLASAENRYATRWYGYSMANVLILVDPVASRIRPSQMTALLDWTRRGGVLVLAGANRLAEALSGELGEAAGVGAVSVHYVSKMRVSGLRLGTTGLTEVTLPVPLPMAELVPSGAQVLHECNGMPLLTRNALGEGAVFTLAMPVGSLLDKELQEVWGGVRRQLYDLPPVRSADFLKSDEIRTEIGAMAAAIRDDPNFSASSPADQQQIVSALDDLKFYGEPGLSVLSSLAGRKAPPRWVPVTVLAALAALVAVGGAILRRRRRGEILWFALAPVAIILAGALYFVGLGLSKPAESLRFVGLVSSEGGGRTRVQEAYSYYSGHETRHQTFSAGCGEGVIVDAGDLSGGAVNLSETRTDREMLLPDQTIEPSTDKKLYVDGVVSDLKFQPDVTFDAAGLAGTIQNDLGFDLVRSVIYVNGRTYRLGTDGSVPKGLAPVHVGPEGWLGPGEAVNLRQPLDQLTASWSGHVAPRPPAGARGGRAATSPPPTPSAAPAPVGKWLAYVTRGEFTASLSFDNTDVLRNRLLGCLASARSPMRIVEEWPLLIGYGDRGVLDPLKGRPLEGGRQGWNVVVWPLRIKAPPAGTPVKVPSGFARVQFGGLAADVYETVMQAKTLRPGFVVTIRAQLPAGMPGLKDASATLTLNASAKNYRMTVKGRVAATKRDQQIDVVDRPLGKVRVPVPSADAFATADGAYLFVLEFKSLAGGGDEDLQTGNTFEGADVDLEGIAR